MRTSAPRALCSSGLPCAPGTRIMSPKAVKTTVGIGEHGEAVVDAAHRQHADRAARAVHQFDVRREQVLQSEAIDGVGVAAAHFHEAVMAARDRRAGGSLRPLSRSPRDREIHRPTSWRLQVVAFRLLARGVMLAQHRERPDLVHACSSLILLIAKPTWTRTQSPGCGGSSCRRPVSMRRRTPTTSTRAPEGSPG